MQQLDNIIENDVNEDDSLQNRVQTAIETSPYLTGRKLRFEASQGRVVLRGVVDTYFQKQMAQETLRRVAGVQQIDNALEVTWR